NYYLGCDTTSGCPCLITGINDIKQYDFKFSISPNPSNGNFKIMYLLPQNSKGVLEVFDLTGKKVFSYNLPQWSTLQNFDLSFLSNGVYHCSIKSGNYYVQKKLAIIRY
ncbi:MAG TPA: T9SS type A sorting domain-containing protein, partial [Bacteroidia bacterium]|nr:T9SS type A sorting domain-containing protein [Bacteroidia bacterium]